MKRFVKYFMNLICTVVFFTNITHTELSAQVVVDCPQIPTYGFFQRDCFIKCEQPYGEIRLPQGSVDGLNSMRNLSITIPTNRPTWALAIAHSWNYNRNIIKKVDYPKISYWLAITGHEIGMTCDCGTTFLPGHIPWVDAVNSGGTTWPIECAATRNNKGDGCFQMEEGNGYGSLNQVYPDRFPCSNFGDMISNENFETAALSMAYRNTYNHFLIDYSWGMDIWPLIENTVDQYAYERILATGWNSWAGGLHQNLTARYPASFPYDLTTPAGRAAVLSEDFWDLTGNKGYYPDVIGWVCAVLDSNIQAGTQYNGLPTIHAAHSTPAGAQSHVHIDNYNADISWQTVSDYLDTMFGFYHEFNTPALQAPIVANVQAVFTAKAGGLGGVIPFKNIGPVIDEIILNFPKENPLMTIIHDDGYPQGPLGNQMSKCIGNYAPASHIEKRGVTTDTICIGQSVILEAMIDGGDGPNLIYDWIVDGAATSVNSKEYVFTGSALGDHTFTVNVCNPQLGGCANACCEISVFVKQCTACTLSATSTSTNTPCESMWKGSIDLTVLGSASYTVLYDGPKVGTETGTGGSHTISNLPDGVYNITLTDVSDPTCVFFLTETVGYTTAMNDNLTASIQTLNACDAILQTEITQKKCECAWKVGFNTSYGAWGRSTSVIITTSGGGKLVLKGDVALNPSPDVVTDFNLCTGETIHAEIFLRKASGGCTNGAVTTPEHPVTLWVLDPTGAEVLRVTVPLSSINQTTNAFAFDYNVSCPYAPDPYTYAWEPGGLTGTPVNVSSNTTENVIYTVTATNTNNPQCTLSDTVMVPFTCTVVCASPTSALSSTQTSFCQGDSVPISVVLTGAQPWNIKVSDGTTSNMHTGITTSPYVFYALTAGTYSVDSVFDANSCPSAGDNSTAVLTVNTASKPNLGLDSNVCYGAAAVVFDAGTYVSYGWLPGGQTGQTINATLESEYIVNVVDANGCSASDSISLNVDTLVSFDLGSDTTICFGSTIDLDVGATYNTYSWSGQGLLGVLGTGKILTVTGSASGSTKYFAVASDLAGCTSADSIIVTVNPEVTLDLGADTVFICPGSNITVNPVFQGGNGSYNFLWQDESAGLSFTTNVEMMVKLTVTDGLGCTAVDSTFIKENANLVVSLADAIICAGDSLSLNTGYDAVNYNIIWNTSETTQYIDLKTAGTYGVVVDDGNGCSGSDSMQLSLYAVTTLSIGNDTNICEGTSLTLDAGSGYTTYLWSDATTSSTMVAGQGTHNVVAMDNNACVSKDTVIIGFIAPPSPNNLSDLSTCVGNASTFSVSAFDNGNGPFTFLWQDGSTMDNVILNSGTVGSQQVWVEISDVFGCAGRDSALLTVSVGLPVSITADSLVKLCAGTSVTLVSNLTNSSMYNFNWTPSGETSSSIAVTSSPNVTTEYILTVDDGTSCQGKDTVYIADEVAVSVNLGADTTLCEGTTLTIDAGLGYDSYLWSTGESSQTIEVSSGGVNWVKVSKSPSCPGMDTVFVSYTSSPVSTLDHQVEFIEYCFEKEAAAVLIAGNTSANQYLWSPTGSTSNQITVDSAGIYSVTITSDNCSILDSVEITTFCHPALYVPSGFTPDGDGRNDHFEVRGNVEAYEMNIFNRWGELVFSSSDINTSWNGMYQKHMAQVEVYVYQIHYQILGKKSQLLYKYQVGTVSLIR
jgi:gliding motility-associated-like protein